MPSLPSLREVEAEEQRLKAKESHRLASKKHGHKSKALPSVHEPASPGGFW